MSPDAPGRDAKSLRPFRAGLFFAGTNGLTWMVGIGSPMILMAERLGADASQMPAPRPAGGRLRETRRQE